MMDLHFYEFLGSGWFRFGIVPVISTLLIVFVRRESRESPLEIEDFAVGIELMVTALVMHLMTLADLGRELIEMNKVVASGLDSSQSASNGESSVQKLSQLINSVFLLFSMCMALWAGASFVRHQGRAEDGSIRLGRGVIMPIGLGLFFLYAVLWSASPHE